jgi:hypothetical protein
VNAVPYGTVGEGCPPVPLPSAVGADLSSCLSEGRLTLGRIPIQPSVFDVDALRAVEHAVMHGGSVLICPADPLSSLPALVPAAVHIGAMIRDNKRTGRFIHSPLRIGVVATDPRLRGFYRALAISPRPGGAGEPLRSIVAAATVGRNGRLSVIDRDDGRWSTVFVESVAAARALGGLDLLVVNLPVVDADAVSEIGAPTVVVARDPADPSVVRLARRMPAFGYDWALGNDIPADTAPRFSILSTGDDGKRIGVLPVTCPALCADAGLFWTDISTLVRLGRRSGYVSTLLAQAFGLFHDLVGLAMPVSTYDRLAGVPLRERIGALARAARVVADSELRADWLPMVEAELAGMLHTLEAAACQTPRRRGAPLAAKAEALPEVAADILDAGKDALLVTRTAALARIYTDYLRDVLPGVRVTSLGALATSEPAEVAILLGAPPTWGRWVYRSRVARRFVVLAYAPHTPGRDIPLARQQHDGGPFDEVAIVANAVGMQKSAGLRLSLPEQRSKAWTAVQVGACPDGTALEKAPESVPDDLDLLNTRPPEVPPGLWDGEGWTAQLEPKGGADGVDDQVDAGGTDMVAGLRVLFEDGSWAWLRASRPVWRWRSHARRTEPLDANRISVGDELVFIDGDAHKTLLANILKVAEDVPELAVAGAWVAHWRTALVRALARCGSYVSLARHLAAHGCGVQAQTIRLWCIGVTVGPDDPADLRRLGLLLDDDALTTRHEEVWRAMQTLRHAHMRLGKRLAALTRSLGPASSRGAVPADEILDAASGLTAADVETAVVVLTVARIEPVPAVPALMTGRRWPADQPADSFHVNDLEEIR